jgi:hypothetical protein
MGGVEGVTDKARIGFAAVKESAVLFLNVLSRGATVIEQFVDAHGGLEQVTQDVREFATSATESFNDYLEAAQRATGGIFGDSRLRQRAAFGDWQFELAQLMEEARSSVAPLEAIDLIPGREEDIELLRQGVKLRAGELGTFVDDALRHLDALEVRVANYNATMARLREAASLERVIDPSVAGLSPEQLAAPGELDRVRAELADVARRRAEEEEASGERLATIRAKRRGGEPAREPAREDEPARGLRDAEDAARGFGDAIGDAAVSYGDFGDLVEATTRRMVADMIGAQAQALLLRAATKGLGFLGGLFDGGGGGAGSSVATVGAGNSGFGATPIGPEVFPSAAGNAFATLPTGLISRPMAFSLGGGSLGLAGERGPEIGAAGAGAGAVLPLARTPGGELGVRASAGGGAPTIGSVVVNVHGARTPGDFRRAQSHIARDLETTLGTVLGTL